jgi:hypothetical protein
VFILVGLSSLLHLQRVLLDVEVSSVAQQLKKKSVIWTPTVNCPGRAIEETLTPNKIAEDDVETTKGLQKWTQLIEWDGGETWK